MPLYLFRWPDLKASLIKAKNEGDLVDLIDQVGDPGGCTWEKYTGPVWIDFQVPVELKEALRDASLVTSSNSTASTNLLEKTFGLVASVTIDPLVGPEVTRICY